MNESRFADLARRRLVRTTAAVAVLGLVLVGRVLKAQAFSSSTSFMVASSELRSEMSRLIRQDAKKASPLELAADAGPAKTEDVVVLERLEVVGERTLPEFARPRETKVAQVLRTGTIAERVGKKTTLRLWTSGDAGLVLSLRW